MVRGRGNGAVYHAELVEAVPEATQHNRRLMHPYLASLRYIRRVGRAWLVVVDGGGRRVRAGALTATQAAQVALALHFLHGRGFMHGSVGAWNVREGVGEGGVVLGGAWRTLRRVPLDDGVFEGADWYAFGMLLGQLGRRDRDGLLVDAVRQMTLARTEDRLGFGPGGFHAIKAHPFFAAVDWDALLEAIMDAASAHLDGCDAEAVAVDVDKDVDKDRDRDVLREEGEYDWRDAVRGSSEDMLMLEQVVRNSYGSFQGPRNKE